MNIMVTGGKGYLGRYIVEDLLKEGHKVINYCREMQLPNEDPNNVFALGEITDISRLISVIKEYNVERIIHTAAQSHPDISLFMPFATVEANTMGLMAVFEAARLTNIRRVVCYSSDAAYGDALTEPVTEEHPLCPNTPYGVTKAAAEMMARAYNKCYDMDIIALRCCALYGPGQVMPEYVRDVIKAAYSGETLKLPSGYDQKFNLVYVTDAASASLKACFTKTRSDFAAYNITSGYQPTLGEIMEVVKQAIPNAMFDVGPGVIEGWDQHGFFSIEAAKRDLGYEPKVSFEEGMEKYIAWLQENGY